MQERQPDDSKEAQNFDHAVARTFGLLTVGSVLVAGYETNVFAKIQQDIIDGGEFNWKRVAGVAVGAIIIGMAVKVLEHDIELEDKQERKRQEEIRKNLIYRVL